MPLARPSRVYYGWIVVGVALLMNVAASPTNAVAFSFFVDPMSDDLGWSAGDLGLALAFRLGVAGLTAPFLGAAVDRFGARVLGTLAGLIAGVCIMALAAVQELWQFYLLFAISGLSGFGGPAGQLLTTVPVAKWFMAKRGRALAIATVGMPLGTAFFVPIEQTLIDLLGWRDAWLVSGAIVLVLAVPVCWLFMRKDPESMGLRPDGVAAGTVVVRSAYQVQNETDEEWTLREVMRSRVLWLIFASMALTGIVVQGTLVYRVSFWTDAGIEPSVVALGTAFDPFTVVFSALIFGVLAERVRLSHLGLIGGLGVAASMVPMVFAGDHAYLLFAHNIIWGASMGANITVNNLIWPNYFGRRFLGTIRGVSFPVLVGTAAVSTPIFAFLLDAAPEERLVWVVTLAAFAVSGLLLFVARPPRRPSTGRPEREPVLAGLPVRAVDS